MLSKYVLNCTEGSQVLTQMSLEHLLHIRLGLSTFMSDVVLRALCILKNVLTSPKTSDGARVAREDFSGGRSGHKGKSTEHVGRRPSFESLRYQILLCSPMF